MTTLQVAIAAEEIAAHVTSELSRREQAYTDTVARARAELRAAILGSDYGSEALRLALASEISLVEREGDRYPVLTCHSAGKQLLRDARAAGMTPASKSVGSTHVDHSYYIGSLVLYHDLSGAMRYPMEQECKDAWFALYHYRRANARKG